VRLYDRALNASDIEALRTGSDSSASSESQSGAGGGRGNYTAASYNVDLRSHQYVMASSSSSSSSSSSHHAAAPVRADQSVVARICSRLARRQFSPAALERINVRLLQRFGSTCAVR
jgi:hypothetical protein